MTIRCTFGVVKDGDAKGEEMKTTIVSVVVGTWVVSMVWGCQGCQWFALALLAATVWCAVRDELASEMIIFARRRPA